MVAADLGGVTIHIVFANTDVGQILPHSLTNERLEYGRQPMTE